MESSLSLQPSWRVHYPFLSLFYFNVFCSCASYALILPSLWSYLIEGTYHDSLVAQVLTAFSIGEVIGALGFGFLRDRISTRSALLSTLFCGLIGTSLTIYASMIGESYKIPLIIGRMLQGVWNGGEQAVEQSYISEIVSDISKLSAISEIGIAGVCGYTLGPVIGVAISFLDMNVHQKFSADEYWSIGVFLFIINLTMILINWFSFQEIPIAMRVNRSKEYEGYEPPKVSGILICLLFSFCLFYGFTVQETITGPLVSDSTAKYTSSFGYSISMTYIYFILEGFVSVLGLFLISFLNEKIDDRILLAASTFLGVIGWFFFIDFEYKEISHAAFYIGFILISLEFSMARNAAFSVYSKIIGPYPAGWYMGLMLASGCLSRALTPYWAMQSIEISIKICAISCCASLFLSLLLVIIFWESCAPHPKNELFNNVILDFCNDSEASATTPLIYHRALSSR
ncbi:hypothetical protein SteCoe_9266 [Stentor coeruleus]|uniref:Major facilitator superfamily (MFS) profile domain-containing protein n=1 Tax=Stentor coeruleus TaxID=5963 RepID=A0A1R2CI62_9CILI|nr:hypothetical protein SteCoe_9266 [Stentor coeruleus]